MAGEAGTQESVKILSGLLRSYVGLPPLSFPHLAHILLRLQMNPVNSCRVFSQQNRLLRSQSGPPYRFEFGWGTAPDQEQVCS